LIPYYSPTAEVHKFEFSISSLGNIQEKNISWVASGPRVPERLMQPVISIMTFKFEPYTAVVSQKINPVITSDSFDVG
jgi:hypothetical protein